MKSRVWAALAAAVLCAACGGGGGGGGGAPANPAPVTSGLVPAASPLGAILIARALDLRPVIAGAQWVYHRNDYTSAGPGQITTTATSQIANGVIEVDSDDPSTAISVTVDPTDGSVVNSVDLQLLPTSAPVTISGYELRSPVTTNDQYVLLDQHIANSGLDVDGDSRQDALDIAAYRVVVGLEQVALPNGMPPVAAIRVDTFIVARITPSSGTAAQTATDHLSAWYAAGLGVVRTATHSSTTGRPYDSEAWLTGFDGVTHGWGAVVRSGRLIPGTAQWLGPASDAVLLPDGVLAMTPFHVVKLDIMGRLTTAIPYAQAGIGSDGGRLAATNGGLRYVVSGNQNDIQIAKLGADGTRNPGDAVAHIDLAAFNDPSAFILLRDFAWAPGCDRFWMVWLRRTVTAGSTQDELVARSFDPDGQAVSPEIVLPSVNGVGVSVLVRVTDSNGVLVTWSESGSSYAASAQAQLDRDGNLLWSARELLESLPGPCCVFPIGDVTGTWLTWRGDPAFGTDGAYGVRLDDAGQFVGAPSDGSAFASELLSQLDASFSIGWPTRFSARDGQFHATATVFGAPYPDDARAFNHLEYAQFDAGSGSLKAGLRQTKRMVLDGLVSTPQVRPFVLEDRVLILADDGAALRPTIIWR